MQERVEGPTQQGQVGQGRRSAPDPPDEVMAIAPAQRPVTAGEDAMPVARLQRPPRRWRNRPRGVIEFMFELTLAGDPRDRGIAGVALHRRGWHRATALKLARGGSRNARQGVEAGPDDQLRPRASTVTVAPGTIAPATGPLPAELDQRIVLPLTMATVVVFDRLHKGLQRGPYRGTTHGIEQTVDPDHAILRLAQVQIAPLMGAV